MSNNNNNNNNNNGNSNDDLPEQKKTAKRLLEVDEEEVQTPPIPSNGTDDNSMQVDTTTTTTVVATTTAAADVLSPQQRPMAVPSPKLFNNNNNDAAVGGGDIDQEQLLYFSGRRIITESSSSDISGSEDKPKKVVKRVRMVRREGKIYDLLERKIGSSALKSIISDPNPAFDWPYELVLVRHGQSEGNEAQARSKRGDLSAYTPEFKKKHSSTYRLTDKGILQAHAAGKWIRENIAQVFDRYYTSEYVRAMETAALLGMDDAQWLTEIQLRERDKGKMDNISFTEKNENFSSEMELRKRDSFFWAPPGGESIAQICSRVEHTFTTLRRECANKRVVIVCHGEIMWAFRVRLERLSSIRFHQLQASNDPRDQIHNTSILWYTRVHPKTGEIYPYFRFLRSVCPWRPQYSAPGWLEFDRPIYTNDELMESVRTVPRFVNNQEGDDSKSTSSP
ncbi:hypothetical protein SAMD00019534_004460 [Acytostelium subglobosum LB1]|uniref:hypothetical protein n=1 Tax=Acytostelium subglobosum LB1 TaxID=1410327 RepID=UPI000644D20D|nr:hypothetical protein SAMD00019534_004460 [Acytostelium subglobosum LB1]GAM17271.1 hypothetical protein SAMD00019534_004460 [Acytostelium subglobosum LB1]|eukprot:XP_012759333.1 hypothetical protein SAMD00019534_004460 [Acytostelium subglobosum LB1]